ncbi:MAG: amidohydrolase family protein, partial [Anaerolineales bacterium]|nr:amidohydrolase family protein [Anaerolineales bacterium]
MNHLLIENCDVLRSPAANQVAIEPGQDILLSGNRIVALGPTGTLAVPDGAERLAGTGLLCTPGFINTHAHVPMVLFRGIAEDVPINRWFNDYIWPVESNLTEEDVYWGTQLSLLEMIESGVTTVADHYFYMDEVARAVSEAGTRAVLGWAVFGSQGLEVLAQSAEFVARWQHGADGRITTLMAPHAPYTCDDDFLRATVRHAERLDVGIHIHAAENVQQTESSMAGRGQTPIEVLR